MTGCDCPMSGWCERHRVNKTPHLLHLCRTNDRYHQAWEEGRGIGQKVTKAQQDFQREIRKPREVCIHRGEAVSKADCGCAGSPTVYQCGIHTYAMDRKLKPGRVRFAIDGVKQSADVGYCVGCEQFVPKLNKPTYPEITKRNLIYHIYPAKGYLELVEEIAAYRSVFNGQVVVAIALDDMGRKSRIVADVDRILDPTDVLVLHNCPVVRETATFETLTERVLDADESTATFYAHTKAISTADDKKGAERWRQVMVKRLLGSWEDAMSHLRHHTFVGTHKMIWRETDAPPYPTRLRATYQWMHAGTFWWFRHDRVSALMEQGLGQVPLDRYAVEAWPSQLIPHQEAYSMWQPWGESEDAYPQRTPYDPRLYDHDYSK